MFTLDLNITIIVSQSELPTYFEVCWEQMFLQYYIDIQARQNTAANKAVHHKVMTHLNCIYTHTL